MFRKVVVVLAGVFFFVTLLSLAATGALEWWYQRAQKNLLNALNSVQYREFSTPTKRSEYQVFGFLPYWTMNTAEVPASVTDVAYFAITFDGNGQLVQEIDGGTETGYARLQSDTFTEWVDEKAQNRKLHITVTGQGNEEIAQLVVSPVARQKFRQTITQLLASYPFAGLQLDFEYAGVASDSVRQGYVQLVQETNKDLEAMDPQLQLTVAVFGSAASNQGFWDVPALAPHVDRIIIMSYDYHVRSSDVAGPVAPLFGKETGRWQDDITSNLRDFLTSVPPEKILLGVPFYGYEWQISGSQPGSPTFPSSGATATYKRVQELRDERGDEIQEGWDSAALSPYIFYQEAGENRLIYYDNPRSLSYKLDLIRQLELGGIAIWALGYEGDQTELWQVIDQKL